MESVWHGGSGGAETYEQETPYFCEWTIIEASQDRRDLDSEEEAEGKAGTGPGTATLKSGDTPWNAGIHTEAIKQRDCTKRQSGELSRACEWIP